MIDFSSFIFVAGLVIGMIIGVKLVFVEGDENNDGLQT